MKNVLHLDAIPRGVAGTVMTGWLPRANVSLDSIMFAGNPKSKPDVAGYVLLYGTETGGHTSAANIRNQTNTTVSGLAEAVTASDSSLIHRHRHRGGRAFRKGLDSLLPCIL
jgi:hypothetical protein